MTPAQIIYREDIRIPAIQFFACVMGVVSLTFIALAFIDPFGQNGTGGNGAFIFFVPAAAFFFLALFAASIGRFKIIATTDRFTVGAGMNTHTVAWGQVKSAADDLSRPQPCNPLTAVPTSIAGEKAMIYAIGCLPRIELVLKNNALRYLVIPTRNAGSLLELVRDRSREARRFGIEESDQQVDLDSLDRGRPDGVGGPPPFLMPM